MQIRSLFFSVLVSPLCPPAGFSPPMPPLDARQWQLFFDNTAIARATGFERVVHHPRARGVVIDNDKPWDTIL